MHGILPKVRPVQEVREVSKSSASDNGHGRLIPGRAVGSWGDPDVVSDWNGNDPKMSDRKRLSAIRFSDHLCSLGENSTSTRNSKRISILTYVHRGRGCTALEPPPICTRIFKQRTLCPSFRFSIAIVILILASGRV